MGKFILRFQRGSEIQSSNEEDGRVADDKSAEKTGKEIIEARNASERSFRGRLAQEDEFVSAQFIDEIETNEQEEQNMKDIKVHPLAEKFPMMPEPEITELATSIKTHGLKEPLVLFEGKILDGRNRKEACERAGLKLVTREFGSEITDGSDPIQFVIDRNIHRRHLTDQQRIELAAEFAGMERGRPKKGDETENGSSEPLKLSVDKAAKKFNVKPSAVKRAVKVKKHASKAIKEKLKAGKISLSKAAKVAKEPKPKQVKALKAEAKIKKQGPKATMLAALDAWWVEHKEGLKSETSPASPDSMVRHFRQLVEKALK